jgi:hypothetical protein
MPDRGTIRLNIQRGAEIGEFARLLTDLEATYFALLYLPNGRTFRRLLKDRDQFFDLLDAEIFAANYARPHGTNGKEPYPKDRLEISRISINSPGWMELVGALNPLQQIREYLKDRHERRTDRSWRDATEKERALLENAVLREQVEREKLSTIKGFYDLLEHMDISPEARQRILWERLGPVMMRLGRHQDAGLLGAQDDEKDTEGI